MRLVPLLLLGLSLTSVAHAQNDDFSGSYTLEGRFSWYGSKFEVKLDLQLRTDGQYDVFRQIKYQDGTKGTRHQGVGRIERIRRRAAANPLFPQPFWLSPQALGTCRRPFPGWDFAGGPSGLQARNANERVRWLAAGHAFTRLDGSPRPWTYPAPSCDDNPTNPFPLITIMSQVWLHNHSVL